MKKFLLFLSIPIFLIASSYCFVVFFLPLSIPPLPSSTIFLDKNEQEIGEIVYSGSIRHRDIGFEEIPKFYQKSLITLEDQTFWTNNGISIGGVIRSILHNIQAGAIVEGGTTLSSGLIRNTFWIGEKRTFGRKILEFLYALRINSIYSKEQILTEYINRVNFGYMNYGLKSAAKYYFDRSPADLTPAEQIALLILPKDSQKYDPYKKPKNFRTRFESVVNTLVLKGIITTEEQSNILSEKLIWNQEHTNTLPYVADFLTPLSHSLLQKERSPGGEVKTTFDTILTEEIDTLAKNTLNELAWKNVSEYGILIAERPKLNPGVGPELRVMIGGTNYSESIAGQVNTTLALRQPGSTIKPFTYVFAFETLGLTPESTILDLPIAYKTDENYAYEPKNYSQDYKGEITLRQALSESVNIPAIKLAEQVKVPVLLEFLRELGITSLKENADHYGLGLTLGNGEVSLYELLQAYTLFAHEGKFCPFVFSQETIPCKVIIDKKYTDMVVSILTDRYAKLGGFPLYSSLDFSDRNVFVKTGTSRNFRDNWTIGFTDHYMIGVWTGNKNGENMKGVTGATGAGEIFKRIVYALEKTEKIQVPLKQEVSMQKYLTITNPLEGSLYKKEGLRSEEKEQISLRFNTNIPYDTFTWMLDGQNVSRNFIAPVPGNHIIEIVLLKDGEIIKTEKNTFRMEGTR